MDRVIVNANTNEPDVLLNQRMSYVAISRAREDAMVYTYIADELGEALDQQVDKEMALEEWQTDQLSITTNQQAVHGVAGYCGRPTRRSKSWKRGSERRSSKAGSIFIYTSPSARAS
ncbi:MAG: hypothetical protein M3R15_08920, partial [Acidobacteriota bacterium]|nr:hypothetical protein [Acidobacteriota bacterium]